MGRAVLVKLTNKIFVVNLYKLSAALFYVFLFISCQDNEADKSTERLVPDTTVTHNSDAPLPVIFDSDMGPDYDDVGAIAMLHNFADEGSANILATIASTKYNGVAEL